VKYRFQCADCGYAYKSFWYEPNWIAKYFYVADHKSFHYNSWLNDYPSQWKRYGAESERERIIKLLEEAKADELDSPCKHATFDGPLYRCDTCEVTLPLNDLIALIKGENK
jgi:hypothetical protein